MDLASACAVWTAPARHRTEEIQQEIDQLSKPRLAALVDRILFDARFASGFLCPGATESGVVAAQLDSRSSVLFRN